MPWGWSADAITMYVLSTTGNKAMPSCRLQVQDLARAANPDPWQVAQYEASLAAGESPAEPGEVHLLKELEMVVEPECQGSSVASEEQPHMRQ